MSNPAIAKMAQSVMSNPAMMQSMMGMMGGMGGMGGGGGAPSRSGNTDPSARILEEEEEEE
jgi:hypothetical protein